MLNNSTLDDRASCPFQGGAFFRRRSFLWQRPLRVQVTWRGSISGLILCEQPSFMTHLVSGEVEVQVKAVGLNFKDILNVLGELPQRFLTPPGDDCAGTIAANCSDPGLQLGSQVFGTATGCLSNLVLVRTDTRLVVPRPPAISAQESCTLPSTWTTVHVVLHRGLLRASQRFLLHAATGGVGLVAVEYLHHHRGFVLATAGQQSKHTILRNLGLYICTSSRNPPSFGFGITQQSARKRIQGVLNSLSDDFIASSTAVLNEIGIFEEIGKRGAWSTIRMRACTSACQVVIDLATDYPSDLAGTHTLLHKLAFRTSCRTVHGLPFTAFSITNVHGAFSLLKAGGNVGKVVVVNPLAALPQVGLHPAALHSGAQSCKFCVTHSIVNVQSMSTIVEGVVGDKVDADAPLMESGVDSLGAVELRNQLQHAASVDLPSTVMFDHPTVRQLAIVLEPKFKSLDCTQQPPSGSHTENCSGRFCIAGRSCLVAGGADALAAMLQTGSDGVREVPFTRWDARAHPALPRPIACRVRHGGFVRGAELADNAAFTVSPAEAAAMDPCQRLLLEAGYGALHDAKIGRTTLDGSLTGIFLGIAGSEFAQLLALTPAGGSVYAATGSSGSIAAGRLAYVLALHGPSNCVTGCRLG